MWNSPLCIVYVSYISSLHVYRREKPAGKRPGRTEQAFRSAQPSRRPISTSQRPSLQYPPGYTGTIGSIRPSLRKQRGDVIPSPPSRAPSVEQPSIDVKTEETRQNSQPATSADNTVVISTGSTRIKEESSKLNTISSLPIEKGNAAKKKSKKRRNYESDDSSDDVEFFDDFYNDNPTESSQTSTISEEETKPLESISKSTTPVLHPTEPTAPNHLQYIMNKIKQQQQNTQQHLTSTNEDEGQAYVPRRTKRKRYCHSEPTLDLSKNSEILVYEPMAQTGEMPLSSNHSQESVRTEGTTESRDLVRNQVLSNVETNRRDQLSSNRRTSTTADSPSLSLSADVVRPSIAKFFSNEKFTSSIPIENIRRFHYTFINYHPAMDFDKIKCKKYRSFQEYRDEVRHAITQAVLFDACAPSQSKDKKNKRQKNKKQQIATLADDGEKEGSISSTSPLEPSPDMSATLSNLHHSSKLHTGTSHTIASKFWYTAPLLCNNDSELNDRKTEWMMRLIRSYWMLSASHLSTSCHFEPGERLLQVLQNQIRSSNVGRTIEFSTLRGDELAMIFYEASRALKSSKCTNAIESGMMNANNIARNASRIIPLTRPKIRLGFNEHWLDVTTEALPEWEKLLLEPYAKPKKIRYMTIAPKLSPVKRILSDFFANLNSAFVTCRLGQHLPLKPLAKGGSGSLNDDNVQNDQQPLNHGIRWLDMNEQGFASHISRSILQQEFIKQLHVFVKDLVKQQQQQDDEDEDRLDAELRGLGKEEHLVVYVVSPFGSDSSMQATIYNLMVPIFERCLSILKLPSEPHIPLHQLPVFRIVDIDDVLSAFQESPLSVFKDLAIDVFNECRSSSQWTLIDDASSGFDTMMYEPAFVLTPEFGQGDNGIPIIFMHCTYAVINSPINGQPCGFVCTWTDSTGHLIESAIYRYAPSTTSDETQSPVLCFQQFARDTFQKIYERTFRYMRGLAGFIWRLVLNKHHGPMFRWELEEWQKLLRDPMLLISMESAIIMSTHESGRTGMGTQFLLDFVNGTDSDSDPLHGSEDFAFLEEADESGNLCHHLILEDNFHGGDDKQEPVDAMIAKGYLVSRVVTDRGSYQRQTDFHTQRYSPLELDIYGVIHQQNIQPQKNSHILAALFQDMYNTSWINCSSRYPHRYSTLPVGIQVLQNLLSRTLSLVISWTHIQKHDDIEVIEPAATVDERCEEPMEF